MTQLIGTLKHCNDMMKISFKDNYKDVLTFQNKVTVVTLTGSMVIELEHIPHNIWTWALEHPSIDISVTYSNSKETWILKASGKAKCHAEDTPNAVIGERIAESRAKIRLYKFMYTFTKKLLKHHLNVMYGNREIKLVRELITKSAIDCVWVANSNYRALFIKESQHLGKLMEEL